MACKTPFQPTLLLELKIAAGIFPRRAAILLQVDKKVAVDSTFVYVHLYEEVCSYSQLYHQPTPNLHL